MSSRRRTQDEIEADRNFAFYDTGGVDIDELLPPVEGPPTPEGHTLQKEWLPGCGCGKCSPIREPDPPIDERLQCPNCGNKTKWDPIYQNLCWRCIRNTTRGGD